MVHLAGDAAREVREQIQRAVADLFDGHGAAHRRVVFIPFQDVAEIADAGRRQRLDRPRRDRVDTDVLVAEISGEITHAGFKSGFGNAHDVVVRHPFFGAVIGQCDDRAAIGQKLLGALRDGRQRVTADQHGLGEIVGGSVEIAAVELILVGEGDGMDHEIDLAPFLPQHLEGRIDSGGIGDVTMAEQDAAKLGRQRLDAFLQRIPLPGQRDLGTRRMARLGDAPGDGPVVGDAEDHPALALHQT